MEDHQIASFLLALSVKGWAPASHSSETCRPLLGWDQRLMVFGLKPSKAQGVLVYWHGHHHQMKLFIFIFFFFRCP